ncbi:transposase [Bradyrhizobium japonicum]
MSRRPTTHELEAFIAAHAAELAALKAENEKLAQRVLHLEEQLRLERLRRYAPTSEKLKERIFNEAEQAAAESRDDDDVEAVAVPDTGLPEAPKPAPKTRGRKPLPDDLPRQRVEHDLGEDQKDCPCCRNRMHRMGETVTEQLHVEVKASVLQHVRFKYACRHCERTALNTPIVTAPMPAQPLPGSVATPSTLALVLANKYVDGTPLYRVADALGRADVSISRGTLGNWVIRASELHLHRVYDALQQKLRSQPLVHGDETWVQVLKEDGRDAQAKSFMWAYRSGQDCAQPVVLFDYQPGRGQEHPQAFLAGYRGLLMSDGYDAWGTLTGATHLGCMAHARRKFTDALKARKEIRGADAPARQTTRNERSRPLVAELERFLREQAARLSPGSEMGKAIAYLLNHWDGLTLFLDDGCVEMDTNPVENQIRPLTLTRKNSLFAGHDEGGRSWARIASLIATCKINSVEPYVWMKATLKAIATGHPQSRIDELLPWSFGRTS